MKKLLLALLVSLGLQMQAQVDWCDSISYTFYPNPNLVFSVIGLTTDSLDSYADTVEFVWEVCTQDLCFSDNGLYASFPLILLTDTVKVCYRALVTDVNWQIIVSCESCDTLVYNNKTWISLVTGNVVGVHDMQANVIKDNKIYDLLGRELEYAPIGVMYIRNQKLYISR